MVEQETMDRVVIVEVVERQEREQQVLLVRLVVRQMIHLFVQVDLVMFGYAHKEFIHGTRIFLILILLGEITLHKP